MKFNLTNVQASSIFMRLLYIDQGKMKLLTVDSVISRVIELLEGNEHGEYFNWRLERHEVDSN